MGHCADMGPKSVRELRSQILDPRVDVTSASDGVALGRAREYCAGM